MGGSGDRVHEVAGCSLLGARLRVDIVHIGII